MVSAAYTWSTSTGGLASCGELPHTGTNYHGRTSLIIDFGGGVKSDEDLILAFENGAQMVTGGSIAVKNPDLFTRWLNQYGSEKIILGADVKDKKVAVNGWKDETETELMPFLQRYVHKAFKRLFVRISVVTVCSRDLLWNSTRDSVAATRFAFPHCQLAG